MKNKILLIGYNFYPEPTGIGKYSGEMMQWLAENGYDCTVVTTYPYYPYWRVQEPYFEKRFWYTTEQKHFTNGGKITIHRCPIYVPEKPSGMKRILLDLSFLVSATFKLISLLGSKADVVITVAPSFQFGLLGVLHKKIHNSNFVYHIQDMQIEAAREMSLIKSNKIINTLFKVEKYILNNADIISSISLGMVNKIKSKAHKEVLLFPNWTDTHIFYPIKDKKSLKQEFNFEIDDKIILYSGAIGEKQGLEAILYAANEYKLHPTVKFVICGSGPYKQKLEELAASLQLKNVIFYPLQPFDKFNKFLNLADIHLVIQKANASDLVMPSKLTTILAVGGLAIITANEESSMHTLVQKYRMGLLVPAEDQNALNACIASALSTDNCTLTENARSYAENYLYINNIMKKFTKDIKI